MAALGEGAAGSSSCCARARRPAARARWRWRARRARSGACGAVLVAEPTTNYPCVAHKGVVWADAVARGKTAHGSMPHLGENAIYKLARAVRAARGLRARGATSTRCSALPTVSLGTFSGGININSVPDRATAGIDVRTVPGLDGDAVLAALRGAARRRGRAGAARGARPDRHRPRRRLGADGVRGHGAADRRDARAARARLLHRRRRAVPRLRAPADDHLRPGRRRAGPPHRRVVLGGGARGERRGAVRDRAGAGAGSSGLRPRRGALPVRWARRPRAPTGAATARPTCSPSTPAAGC